VGLIRYFFVVFIRASLLKIFATFTCSAASAKPNFSCCSLRIGARRSRFYPKIKQGDKNEKAF